MGAPLRLVHANSSSGDEELVDPSDTAQVYRRFAPYVRRLAARILGSRREVDDLVQDVFLDAHSGLRRLKDIRGLRAWLATVTVRKARRRLRERWAMRLVGLDKPVDLTDVFDTTQSADELAMATAIYRILDTLSSDARCAWILHRVEGEPLEKVAEILGCSRATAHRRVLEAHVVLEKELTDARW